MKITEFRTPYEKNSWFLKEYYYEIFDTGISYSTYTKIFFLNWILTSYRYLNNLLRALTSSLSFLRWKDVTSFKFFEKEKIILVEYFAHTRYRFLCTKIVCPSKKFDAMKNLFLKKVGKKKQVHRNPEDKPQYDYL